jgi:hypothetical protein
VYRPDEVWHNRCPQEVRARHLQAGQLRGRPAQRQSLRQFLREIRSSTEHADVPSVKGENEMSVSHMNLQLPAKGPRKILTLQRVRSARALLRAGGVLLDGETHAKLAEQAHTVHREALALLRLKRYAALMIAALLIGSMLSSCATGGQTTPTAPACVFDERCRNPALSPSGG